MRYPLLLCLLITVLSTGSASAQSLISMDAQCASIFGVSPQTMIIPNVGLLNGNTCRIYDYLYQHLVATMTCTTSGVNGITRLQAIKGLNPTFATNLYTLMEKRPSLMITSAYRKNACANDAGVVAASSAKGTDPHQLGCAVDLSYSTNDPCTDTSGTCYWVKTNAPLVGLKLAYLGQAGEANHLQPANLAACAQSGNAPQIAFAAPNQDPGISSGNVCVTSALGQQVCGQQSNPYSQFGQNPLGGNNNSMTSMMTTMMMMQSMQSLNASIAARAAQSSTAVQTASALPAPTPLPPIPITPVSTSVGGSSTLDTLIAALNNNSATSTACTQDAEVCPDGTTVGRTGPSCSFAACPSGTSTVGQIVSPTNPPSTATTSSTSPTSPIGGISISSSTSTDLQSASDSLQAVIAGNGSQSSSVLQTIINDLYFVISSISAAVTQIFGIAPTSPH